ncbi:MAG TPA: YfhO family protein [Verrucomicrobiae bacterium]|jgi:hypothetical protein
MNETARASNWFTPMRFGILLALMICAAFPQVILGLQTFVIRDYGFFAYPLAHFQKEAFWHGQIPFWDPYNYCGAPFLAQWNTMPLYPGALIYLLLPLNWSLSFFCLFHLWFGGLGMYFLARRWTGNNFAAAFAGTVFSFNGLSLNLLMWPSHTATFAWMPWVVLAVEAAWSRGPRAIFLAAMAGAMQMLAGGPEIIFFTWLLLLVLWIQQWVSGSLPRIKLLWIFPFLVATVIVLTAAQLLPFLDLVAHSERHGSFADLRWSMPAWGWANYLVPMFFGDTWNMGGVFFQYGQLWTSSYYLGLGALWLALLAILKPGGNRVRLLSLVAIIAFVFALGENTFIYPALRSIFPPLSLVTYPVKYVLLITFIAPLLAAFTLAGFDGDGGKKLEKWTAVVGVVLAALIGGILFWAIRYPFPGDNTHATVLNGLSRAAFLVVTAVIVIVLLRKSRSGYYLIAPLALIFVAWLDVLTHEPEQNPTVPPTVYQSDLARQKLAMLPQPDLGGSRAMMSSMAFYDFDHSAVSNPQNNFLVGRLAFGANANLLDGVPKVDGFFSLIPRECDDFQSLLYGATNADYPVLDEFMGVSQVTARDQIYHWQARTNYMPLITAGQKPVFVDDADVQRAMTQPDFNAQRVVFLPLEDKALVTITNQTNARVLSSRFETQGVEAEVEANQPSLVVVSQTYYHDWRAFVDGAPTPLLRANEAFQAIQVPSGKHEVRLIYVDKAFQAGAVISICGWGICLAGLAMTMRGRKK